MSNLLPASVSYRRQSVTVYLNSSEDAEKLSRMLAPSGKIAIEQVFSAPAPNGSGSSSSEEGEETASRKPRESAKSASPSPPSTCRGISFFPEEEHGSPGRGRALGFCPTCVKKIPRVTRLEMFEQARKPKSEVATSNAAE